MVPDSLEKKLQYDFKRHELLIQALTHRSFGTPNYERLEFLGDSVLNCTIAEILVQRFTDMPEGDLSRLRASLVNQATLCEIAQALGIGECLRLGEGEVKTGGAQRPSILADAVEALFGAVFLDSGFASASTLVAKIYQSRLDDAALSGPAKDAKTMLQEWLQAQRLALPKYLVERIEGEAHKQLFHVSCIVEERNARASGAGVSRRVAEQEAAAAVFLSLTGVTT